MHIAHQHHQLCHIPVHTAAATSTQLVAYHNIIDQTINLHYIDNSDFRTLAISNARFPLFRCRSSVAVSPFSFPYTVAIAAAYLYALARRRRWLAGQLRNNGNGKNRTRSYFNGKTAIYRCNGTEFSHVIFTEQRNFTMAERRNVNGRTATEWWKPGIMPHSAILSTTDQLLDILTTALQQVTLNARKTLLCHGISHTEQQ